MGSKQALSNGNEPEELTALISAFELQADVAITIATTVTLHGGRRDLLVKASAWEGSPADAVATPLELASALCWGSERVTLMGLLTSLLYALDFALAEREWDAVKRSK